MENSKNKRVYDLEERTAKFGEAIIQFAKKIPQNGITFPLIGQLVKSGTSVGANYCEADCAETKKDFAHKLGISKKEASETKHWLRMIVQAVQERRDDAQKLWQEAHELQLIFITIIHKARVNKDN